MKRQIATLILFVLIYSGCGEGENTGNSASDWTPARVNKCIELFEADQAVYYKGCYGGYKEGLELSQTWADYLVYNMEHKPLDFLQLKDFMRGLVEGGPTPSGHRTPTVIVVLPVLGMDEVSIRSGAWMIQQALAQGVHGVHLPRFRDTEAVKRFVQIARYPIHKQEIDILGEGLRGWGSHKFAAWVWGLDEEEYLKKADVWPLNPQGELMLGIKIEDRHGLESTEALCAIPGIAFAEHGPRDMGFSYGHLEGRADPPMPPEVDEAGQRVLAACQANGLQFLDNVLPDNVHWKLEMGVTIGAGSVQEAAEVGRKLGGRKMPW
jgi:4-hydroxy-2-oxoheptanedioate aldolase